jgi:hypothetical protein
MKKSRLLKWTRWNRPVIDKALSRLAGIEPGLVQQARLAVSVDGWIDRNDEAGERLAQLCEQEAPGENLA